MVAFTRPWRFASPAIGASAGADYRCSMAAKSTSLAITLRAKQTRDTRTCAGSTNRPAQVPRASVGAALYGVHRLVGIQPDVRGRSGRTERGGDSPLSGEVSMTATKALTVYSKQAAAVEPLDLDAMLELAKQLVPTGFLPDHIKSAGQCVAIILTGRELGMQPMRAI